MKYYVIAGEASGDLHGSNLLNAIHEKDANAEFRVWGGNLMQEVKNVHIVRHIKDLAFMGFVEVAKHLNTILGNMKFCKHDIFSFKPDVLILIDYPGFNLRIATWAKSQNIKVVYYISPQIWAWKENRVNKIKKVVDKMLVILPFEQAFYRKHNYQVDYVGHPLVEVIERSFLSNYHRKIEDDYIALLPGSRIQEIEKILPEMLKVIKHFTQSFYIIQPENIDASVYTPYINGYPNVKVIKDENYEILKHAQLALVKSGTSTLETALLGVPQVVCYKSNYFSYLLAKSFIKVPYISLVNLILDKAAVKELIQSDLNEENLINEMKMMLSNKDYQDSIQYDYAKLWEMLAQSNASERAAEIITKFIA